MYRLLKNKKALNTIFLRKSTYYIFPENPELDLYLAEEPDPYGFSLTQGQVKDSALKSRLEAYAKDNKLKVEVI